MEIIFKEDQEVSVAFFQINDMTPKEYATPLPPLSTYLYLMGDECANKKGNNGVNKENI